MVSVLYSQFSFSSSFFSPSAIFVHCTVPPNLSCPLLEARSMCSATAVYSGIFNRTSIHRQIHILEKTNPKPFIASSSGADDGDVCDDCHDSLKSGL